MGRNHGLGLPKIGRLVRRFLVVEDSMRPTLHPGDGLLAVRGGKCIRFPVTDVRVFSGRDAQGFCDATQWFCLFYFPVWPIQRRRGWIHLRQLGVPCLQVAGRDSRAFQDRDKVAEILEVDMPQGQAEFHRGFPSSPRCPSLLR